MQRAEKMKFHVNIHSIYLYIYHLINIPVCFQWSKWSPTQCYLDKHCKLSNIKILFNDVYPINLLGSLSHINDSSVEDDLTLTEVISKITKTRRKRS